MLKKTSL